MIIKTIQNIIENKNIENLHYEIIHEEDWDAINVILIGATEEQVKTIYSWIKNKKSIMADTIDLETSDILGFKSSIIYIEGIEDVRECCIVGGKDLYE